jgi:hypothetical protein
MIPYKGKEKMSEKLIIGNKKDINFEGKCSPILMYR